MMHMHIVAQLLLVIPSVASFARIPVESSFSSRRSRAKLCMAEVVTTGTTVTNIDESSSGTKLDPVIAQQFKIVTCSSPACCNKRKVLGVSEDETYSALYNRINGGNAPNVQIGEVTCLGACKMAPCVAVQHEDFEGTVGLIGMSANEMWQRVFHSVHTEEDYDRVWSSLENRIQTMGKEEGSNDNHGAI